MAPDASALRVGTRASRLALRQTEAMIGALTARWPDLRIERVPISTVGDRVVDVPLPRLGDKGVFTKELEDGLRAGAIDLAVHSLKDLPTEQPDGLALGAVLERGDPRDALVASADITLDALPRGARVGTSSLRRRAQLLTLRPDLDVRDLRGNVPTRVARVLDGDLDAAVLALAGLQRLDMQAHAVQILDPGVMLPAPGQGAIAVQIRADDVRLAEWLAPLDHRPTRLCTTAERALLGYLEGGCQVPVGAWATLGDQGALRLEAVVSSLDGSRSVRRVVTAPVADEHAAGEAGRALAERMIADGAGEILREVRRSVPAVVPVPGGAA